MRKPTYQQGSERGTFAKCVGLLTIENYNRNYIVKFTTGTTSKKNKKKKRKSKREKERERRNTKSKTKSRNLSIPSCSKISSHLYA